MMRQAPQNPTWENLPGLQEILTGMRAAPLHAIGPALRVKNDTLVEQHPHFKAFHRVKRLPLGKL